MKFLCLDIETVPFKIENEHIKEYLMDKKISKEARSLDPNYSKIITIGLKVTNEQTKILSGNNEKELLTQFWDFMKDFIMKHPIYKIVTHNGYKFDIPFILIRSYTNGIQVPREVQINTNVYSMKASNHFDTIQFFSFNGNFINPNLDVLCRMHGIEVPDKRFFGKDVERLYHENNWEIINEHCKQDVEMLEKLFEKVCLPNV